MKVFSRAFTKKEKILILVFVILILGMAYYRFVDMNVRSRLSAAKESVVVNQSELEISSSQLARLNNMDQELNSYEAGGTSYMASYNNVKQELAVIDSILSSVKDYTISLQDPYLDGDLIRRGVSIRFTTDGFAQALSIIRKFSTNELRNIIKDISYSSSAARDGSENVSVNMNLTFYETMTGGTQDAGLIVPVQEVQTVEE